MVLEGLGPVESVEIGRNRAFRVNGKPFFPLMLWAQSLERLEDKLSSGVNTFAGKRGEMSGREYLDVLADNGLYGILHFDRDAVDHPHLLGWIQSDEPDLHKKERAVEIVPAQGTECEVVGSLSTIMNGDKLGGPTFDPLEGAGVTMRPKEPVTACSFSIWVASDEAMAVAKDVLFEADGREILRVTLENRNGEQSFDLEEPAAFAELTLRVITTYPGKSKSGRVNEIRAFGADGAGVFARLRSRSPQMTADEVATHYRQVKEHDKMRPVLMTFTSNFMKGSGGYDDKMKEQIYPEYVKYCDVVGFDTYPIFGQNRPDRLCDVADGVTQLRAIAGLSRPLYAWIETNVGSRWVDPDKQLPLTPQDTRAEVWMAVIRGATAIGYFTHTWWPEYEEFAPDVEMMAELTRLNNRITRLAPAILADPARVEIEMSMDGELPCHFKATAHEGSLYVFAQNMDMERRAGKATVRVAGLNAGAQIEVVDEGRIINADEGAFTDDFGPLAEHVYKVEASAV